jgi:hypothetical protein
MLKKKLEKYVSRLPYVFDVKSGKVSPRPAVLTKKFTHKKGIR